MALLLGLTSASYAASISVNLTPSATVDNQNVDPGETALVGIAGADSTTDGANWNNITLSVGGTTGAPTTFPGATQGGNHIDLTDSTGSDSSVDMTSTGTFWSNYANVSSPNQGVTGDGGLLQGYLNLNDAETISLGGLATWAPNGYKVYAVFDIGPFSRTYGISMNDGGPNQTYWSADTITDSDTGNTGTVSWLQTNATTSGTAVSDANWAVYGTFTGDTLTISGTNSGGRSVLSGFQVVAVPEPSSAALLGLGGLALIVRRRK